MVDDAMVDNLLRSRGRESVEPNDRLIPLVCGKLNHRFGSLFRCEAPGQRLKPTVPCHKAYLRPLGQQRVGWQNRSHVFGNAVLELDRALDELAGLAPQRRR